MNVTIHRHNMKDVIALITFFTTGERTTILVFTGVLSCADFNTHPENSRNRAVFKERKSSVIYCIYNSHAVKLKYLMQYLMPRFQRAHVKERDWEIHHFRWLRSISAYIHVLVKSLEKYDFYVFTKLQYCSIKKYSRTFLTKTFYYNIF